MAPVNVIIYPPATEEGLRSLAEGVAHVHAAAVTWHLNMLRCPANQKAALIDAITKTVTSRNREQT